MSIENGQQPHEGVSVTVIDYKGALLTLQQDTMVRPQRLVHRPVNPDTEGSKVRGSPKPTFELYEFT